MSETTETITYNTCGHTERTKVRWYGNAAQRQSKVQWTADNLKCADCTEAARVAAGEASPMTGSSRQCAWAEDIRNTMRREWGRSAAMASDADQAAADHILSNSDAKWWIEHRHFTVRSLLNPDTPTGAMAQLMSGKPAETLR